MLEPAVAVGQAERRGRLVRLGAVAAQDAGRLEHGGDVGAVGAGVGPDGAADRAGDGQAELQPAQAGPLGERRRPGQRHARLGDETRALHAAALGPREDDQAADAGVADHQVAAAAR